MELKDKEISSTVNESEFFQASRFTLRLLNLASDKIRYRDGP